MYSSNVPPVSIPEAWIVQFGRFIGRPPADRIPASNSMTPSEWFVNRRPYHGLRMARTILVVEDETTLRETLADALEAEGFDVVQAADGRAALSQFRSERPDLILLDLMLPELSGIEVCRIIRAESGVPIVMLTAKESELDKVVGLELGADDYVTKPFSLRELSARIRALFRRSEQAAAPAPAGPPVVDLGRVQVDLAGHRLLRDGEALPIKPKAFELLVFLLRNPGQAFTRDQLLEHVWGYDYAGRDADRRRPRPLAALDARGRRRRPEVHPHGPRRRLRVPAPGGGREGLIRGPAAPRRVRLADRRPSPSIAANVDCPMTGR